MLAYEDFTMLKLERVLAFTPSFGGCGFLLDRLSVSSIRGRMSDKIPRSIRVPDRRLATNKILVQGDGSAMLECKVVCRFSDAERSET